MLMQKPHTVDWWRPPDTAPEYSATHGTVSGRAVPFWALMAFTVVLILSPQSFVPALGHMHLAFVSAASAGLLYVVGRLLERKPVINLTPEIVLVAALMVWAVATIPFSYWPGGSVTFLSSIFIKAVIVFWLLGAVVDSVRKLTITAWVLSLITIPLSVSAVKDFFSGGFHTEEASRGLDRITGYESALTANPNDLALMLNLILPISVALIFVSHQRWARYLLGVIIVLDVLAIIATYSRAGFLTLGVVALCYLIVMLRRGKRGLAVLVMVGMLFSIPLMPAGYLNRLSTIVNIQKDSTGSAQIRLQDVIAATKFVISHPVVGAGIGQDILALNEVRGETWTRVHNVYLEYAVDLGLPGLGLFLLLLGRIMRNVRNAVNIPASGVAAVSLRRMTEGIGISLVAFAIAAFFYPDAYQFYFYYIAGLAVSAMTIVGRKQCDESTAEDVDARPGMLS